jgi:hypothetical protein
MPLNIKVDVHCTCWHMHLKYLQWNELFTIGKSIVHLILCKFKHVVDKIFKNLIWWVENNNLSHVMGGLRTCQVYQVFKGQWCFHIHMKSLKFKFLQEVELFFQIKGVYHAIIRHWCWPQEIYFDIFMKMPRFMNDILCLSSIYQNVAWVDQFL